MASANVKRERNPRSTASIWGHPLHPMLVPIPIGGFIGTLAADLALANTGDTFWYRAGLWLLGAGLGGAAAAAVAGLTDFLGEKKIRDIQNAWLHLGGNVLAVVLQLLNFYGRYTEGKSWVLEKGMYISATVALALLYTGWLGWGLVYRGRVGVLEAGADETPPKKGSKKPE